MTSIATNTPATGAASKDFDDLCGRVRACIRCPQMSHTHTLSEANGPLDARVLFVAEAPGRRGAAITGTPLTGDEAGRRFEAFLALAGLTRCEVFVTNAVLCNPLDARARNRTPSPREVAACRPHLLATLNMVCAPLVVALGRVALDALSAIEPHTLALGHNVATPEPWRGRALIALYHPSRQSTLHRSQIQQEADWLRLSAIATADALSPVTRHL